MTVAPERRSGAGPRLIRELNERLILTEVRRRAPVSRPELGRATGLSKPTVAQALANLERDGLIRQAGHRSGVAGPAAVLLEPNPSAGHVLALDVGRQFIRGAITDLTGRRVAVHKHKVAARTGIQRADEVIRLGTTLAASADIDLGDITQTVIGSPGVLESHRDAITLSPGLPGWERPEVLERLRAAFTDSLVIENDVDAAALAEQAHGHGRDFDSFAFLSIGTGIGMGLVLGGRLHRGAHGAAGEIAFLPISDASGTDDRDARKRGAMEAAASAAGIVRSARRRGLQGRLSARGVFAAAAAGDDTAAAVVSEEAQLVAGAIASIVAVVDPELVVLGGGIGQAVGFSAAVERALRAMSRIVPDVRVSLLGDDSVVDGCLAEGIDIAWDRLLQQSAG